MIEKQLNTIGIMSGTSLDGLDLAYCSFFKKNEQWSFKIIHAESISYTEKWQNKLKNAHLLSLIDFLYLHNAYGVFIGKAVTDFIKKYHLKYSDIDLVASHGHTVFHRPDKQLTVQIGHGASIAATAKLKTISDFRSLDVALGGQGAPLVPIGDELLFSEYDYCLNLGGFGNISYRNRNRRIAYDICPVNMAANYYAERLGYSFDNAGKIGKSGKIDKNLVEKLNSLSFYRQEIPKSLGREWFEADFLPVVEGFSISEEDKLRTVYEHVAFQIAQQIETNSAKKMLITGGGAYNTFLIERIKSYTDAQIIIPDKKIIDFKEALIFAFLGVLRTNRTNNCIASVTGAVNDNCGGSVFI